jgi:hypothetical protein
VFDTVMYTAQIMKGLQYGVIELTGVKKRPLITPFG